MNHSKIKLSLLLLLTTTTIMSSEDESSENRGTIKRTWGQYAYSLVPSHKKFIPSSDAVAFFGATALTIATYFPKAFSNTTRSISGNSEYQKYIMPALTAATLLTTAYTFAKVASLKEELDENKKEINSLTDKATLFATALEDIKNKSEDKSLLSEQMTNLASEHSALHKLLNNISKKQEENDSSRDQILKASIHKAKYQDLNSEIRAKLAEDTETYLIKEAAKLSAANFNREQEQANKNRSVFAKFTPKNVYNLINGKNK